MEQFIQTVGDIARQIVVAVLVNFQHNWLPLSAAIIIAAVLQALVNPERLKRALSRRNGPAIIGAVAVGAFTPLCACGTTAVIVGMLSATVPWGPIMAFLTSSPLMSPDGFVMLTGLISLKFAIGMLVASIVIGLGSGVITTFIEKRTGFLRNQTRFATPQPSPQMAAAPATACACAAPAIDLRVASTLTPCCAAAGPALTCATPACGEASAVATESNLTIKLRAIGKAIIDLGFKQIIPFFTLFVAIGTLISILVPSAWIAGILGPGNQVAIPLAALVGLPLYVSGDSAVPLIKSLLDGGASPGAMLAFMVTGAATSAWVIAGLATFLRRKALLLYVGLILVGGILSGYGYQAAIALGF